jgi:cupin 2 domain-containing protein
MPSLFSDLPLAPTAAEIFDALVERPGVRIERIVSTGQADPLDHWQQQQWDEWILLIQGAAGVMLFDKEIRLEPGDYLFIPAGERHRVSFTNDDPATIWLAVHFLV